METTAFGLLIRGEATRGPDVWLSLFLGDRHKIPSFGTVAKMPDQFSFKLPESFNPAEFLPRYLSRRHDDARYLVSLIVRKMLRNHLDGRGCACLKMDYLQSVMHEHDCGDVVRELVDHGAIERFPYLAHVYSYGYRLSKRFICDNLVEVPATDRRIIGRLQAKSERKESVVRQWAEPVLESIHEKLRDMSTSLSIEDQAYEALTELPKPKRRTRLKHEIWKASQRWQIDNIRNEKWSFGVGSTGRVFTNLTNLTKPLRPFVRLNGTPIIGMDFKCFQPALLGRLWRSCNDTNEQAFSRNCERIQEPHRGTAATPLHPCTKQGIDATQDLFTTETSKFTDAYIELVQSGRFNVYMQKEVESRGFVCRSPKRRFLVDVLAKKGDYASKYEDMFRELFPDVWNFVREFNRENPSALIRELQRLESEFMIRGVSSYLLGRWPRTLFLTLHDAVFVAKRDAEKVGDAFRRGCDQIGYQMKWETD